MSSTAVSDDDPFLIQSELEILSLLRSIQRRATLLRMYMRGNPDQSVMTTLLELDDSTQRVIVDCSPDPDLNARLLKARALVFDTQLNQVNINFTGEGLESCIHDGRPAFSLPYPKALRRIQRREFYRVEIPLGEPASCELTITEGGKAPRHIVVRLKDISAGGVALLDTDELLPHQSGTFFKNAKLTLPESGEATVNLTVHRVHRQVLPNKKEIVELGCAFTDIPKPTSMLVQNYIGRLERRLNAQRHGF